MEQTITPSGEIICQAEGCHVTALFCVTHNEAPNIRFFCYAHRNLVGARMVFELDAKDQAEMVRGTIEDIHAFDLPKPKPAVSYYAKGRIAQFMAEEPPYDPVEELLTIGEEWGQMTQEQRQPFIDEAEIDWQRYFQQVREILINTTVDQDAMAEAEADEDNQAAAVIAQADVDIRTAEAVAHAPADNGAVRLHVRSTQHPEVRGNPVYREIQRNFLIYQENGAIYVFAREEAGIELPLTAAEQAIAVGMGLQLGARDPVQQNP
jgi:hypothetical protein